MPHQCLTCGHAFAEGSSALLAGCPQCKGTRFFYTNAAVSDEERERIAAKAQKDVRQAVVEMLQDAAPGVAKELKERAGPDGWAELRPRDLRRLMREMQAKAALAPPDEHVVDARAEEARARVEAEIAAAAEDERPDTVHINEPGDYEIDVKGLLEKEPVVVGKDGSYMIHLPSLFRK